MPQRVFPPMPEIGRPEAWYAKMVHRADKAGDTFAHEAFKVGQYVTLAMDQHLTWEQKLKYLNHALKRIFAPRIGPTMRKIKTALLQYPAM